jgi:hypothetical protein
METPAGQSCEQKERGVGGAPIPSLQTIPNHTCMMEMSQIVEAVLCNMMGLRAYGTLQACTFG